MNGFACIWSSNPCRCPDLWVNEPFLLFPLRFLLHSLLLSPLFPLLFRRKLVNGFDILRPKRMDSVRFILKVSKFLFTALITSESIQSNESTHFHLIEMINCETFVFIYENLNWLFIWRWTCCGRCPQRLVDDYRVNIQSIIANRMLGKKAMVATLNYIIIQIKICKLRSNIFSVKCD